MKRIFLALATTLALASCSGSNDSVNSANEGTTSSDNNSNTISGVTPDGSSTMEENTTTGDTTSSDDSANTTSGSDSDGVGAVDDDTTNGGVESDTTSGDIPNSMADEGTSTSDGNSGDASGNSSEGTDVYSDKELPEALALENIGVDLFIAIAGFQADKLSLSVRSLAVNIATQAEATPQMESTFQTQDGFGPEVVNSPSQVTAYTCNAGGQMLHESGQLRDGLGTERSLLGDYDAYTFEACNHSEAGGTFTAGDYQLNGQLVMDAVAYNVSSGSRSAHSNSWTDFTLALPADISYSLNGSSSSVEFTASGSGSGDTRSVDLQTYQKTSGSQVTDSLENASLSLIRNIPNGSDFSSYELNVSGKVANSATGGTIVTVATDSPLSGKSGINPTVLEPFSGQIRMSAADGGELFLTGNSDSQISTTPGALLVNSVALRPDGEQISTDAVPLIDIYSGKVNSACFIDDASVGECGTVELP